VSPAEEATYARTLSTLLGMKQERTVDGVARERWISLENEAIKVFNTFRSRINDRRGENGIFKEDARLDEWASKLAGLTLRLALALHMIDRSDWIDPADTTITADAMRRAIELAEYLAEHAARAFDVAHTSAGVDTAKAIWSYIHRHQLTTFTRRDLQRGLTPKELRVVERLAPGLALLLDHGLLTEQRVGKSITYVVRQGAGAGQGVASVAHEEATPIRGATHIHGLDCADSGLGVAPVAQVKP
jgi:hypothetical protein